MADDADHQLLLVIDFGSQYSHLIVRRVRELGVLSELQPCTLSADDLRKANPAAVILSGGPSSVYDDDAPHVLKDVFELGVPVLGICYGLQELTFHHGGKVQPGDHHEYGHAMLRTSGNALFKDIPNPTDVWMSHGDKVTQMPEGFEVIGVTDKSEHAAIYNAEKKIYGIQFHPEVSHSVHGTQLLRNFVIDICGFSGDWTMGSFIDQCIGDIRDQVKDGSVIGAVSGGVDSTVAAVLMHRAIGSKFHAILVDNGLLRLGEAEEVMTRLTKMGINIHLVDASDEFLGLLKGVEEPEKKRKIIGNTFINVFEREATRLGEKFTFLLQGTLYPDVIESISFKGPSATIKTHHNVGGLLEHMKLELVEPLRELFKDEVRAVGHILKVPQDSLMRHPFPGPGLAIRIPGAVEKEACDLLRRADAIYLEELKTSGEYGKIAQAFAVLLPVRSVGVMGDKRTYEQVVAIRAVTTTDFMTADWYPMPYDVLRRISNRIINEVRGINRVVYDVSSKPPSTIEWL